MRILPALIALFLTLAAPNAMAETDAERSYAETLMGLLHPEDADLAGDWQERLEIRLAALEEERAETLDAGAVAELRDRVAADRQPFEIDDLIGDWHMRSIQVDDLGVYAYQYFPARIYPEAQALIFDKNSGSQRHRGVLAQRDDGTVFFVGALYYANEPPRLYSTMMVDETTPQLRAYDAVAELHKIGEDHFLMAFAAPEPAPRFRFYEIRSTLPTR